MEKRIYCLVPPELAGRLHDVLRRHFADDPALEVVVERRRHERRSVEERRAADGEQPERDRRRVRNRAGRRIGDRRAPLVPLPPEKVPPLPRRVRTHAEQLVFVERLAPTSEQAEDADTARLVTRFQAGDPSLFSELYLRYFDRVYGYLRVALNDRHEAEDVTQQVFVDALEGLEGYERRGRPFRAWLFAIARYRGIDNLRRRNRLQVTDPEELRDRREELDEANGAHDPLPWVLDRDLLILIERLPLAQRQVLVLVEMLGLPVAEVAEILGRSPNDVRMLKSRALSFLRRRLTALGRAPRRIDRSSAWTTMRQQTVLRRRRFALMRR